MGVGGVAGVLVEDVDIFQFSGAWTALKTRIHANYFLSRHSLPRQ